MNTIDIGTTSKGKRVWLQGLAGKGITGPRFTVTTTQDTITVVTGPEGKRKITQSKGGIIDIVSKAVTQWAQDATQAHVVITGNTITITRA